MSSSTLEKERTIYLHIQHDPQHENREDLNYEAPRTISSFPLSQEWATGKKSLALSLLALGFRLTPLVLPELALFLPFLCSHPLALQLSSFPSLPLTSCLFSQGHVDVENHNPSTFTSEISFGRCPAEMPSPPWPYPLSFHQSRTHQPNPPCDAHPRALSDCTSPCACCAHRSPLGVSGHTACGERPESSH